MKYLPTDGQMASLLSLLFRSGEDYQRTATLYHKGERFLSLLFRSGGDYDVSARVTFPKSEFLSLLFRSGGDYH